MQRPRAVVAAAQAAAGLGIKIEIASWRNIVPNVWSLHIRDAHSPMCFTNGKGSTKESALASALGTPSASLQERAGVGADALAPAAAAHVIEHENGSIGKAGRTRHLGKMPHNRGVSMNPVDHPLGGGEGKTSGGRHPVSPWGQPTKGYKTRRNKRTTKFIVKRRGKK